MLSHSMQAPSLIPNHEDQHSPRNERLLPVSPLPFSLFRSDSTEQIVEQHAQLWQPANTGQQHLFSYPLNLKAKPPSDHLLRRKTPNGTLAAGYDGSLHEQIPGRPAQKHVLVPVSKFARGSPYHPEITRYINTPRQTRSNIHMTSGREDDGHDASTAAGSDADADAVGYNPNILGVSSNTPIPGLSPGSVQVSSFTTTINHSIPTVLQPLWPPCLGPTALQPPGPVGPYWPDGAFEPYRPAPLREHWHFGSVNHPAERRKTPEVYHPNHNTNSPRFSETRYSDRGRGVIGGVQRPVHKHARKQERRMARPALSLAHDLRFQLAIDQGQSTVIDASVLNVSGTSSVTYSCDVGQPSHSGPTTEHSHFREKTLHWAYRTYCNLLANVEESRREDTATHSMGAHSPKSQRLRRPYPSWSHKTPAMASIPMKFVGSEEVAGSDQRHSSYLRARTMDHSRTSWARYPTGSRSTLAPLKHVKSNCGDASHSGASGPVPRHDFPSAKISSSSHHSSVESDNDAPIAVAVKAMEILSRLCQESHWQWLDGMLLNGCLAYGLGQYAKATKWYLKVLRQDPDNVEAMSNLAATSLALGRKDEAEQYWIQSIKQRPAYFEAVEHLVGLLHDDGRSEDAVNVIEHVQANLRERMTRPLQVPPIPVANPSGYNISPCENGRLLALVHGKGNVLYQAGDNDGAAQAFEDAILIGTGQYQQGICGLISSILRVFLERWQPLTIPVPGVYPIDCLVLLPPEVALETSRLVFPPDGRLLGLGSVSRVIAQRAAISIVSNSLLSLAKIYQDSMSSSGATSIAPRAATGVQGILALYYLSLSLQPSPSTANNVGILLAGIQQPARSNHLLVCQAMNEPPPVPGVMPGSGVALALAYYDYGLRLDANHAHLYTNLGSLFKDIGHLSSAIRMYEKAVECDDNFDIALANLANAVKDRGNIKDAIEYYRRAVRANPDFAEAVCGLANALNSVCNWRGRGGIYRPNDDIDRWHVDEQGLLYDSKFSTSHGSGWMEHVIHIVQKQLGEGQDWGKGVINSDDFGHLVTTCIRMHRPSKSDSFLRALHRWTAEPWEGARVVRLVERATKILTWRSYRQRYLSEGRSNVVSRTRPQLPTILAVPSAPTVLPFHTFTCPLTAKQIRLISQRNALRVSCTTLKAPWLPQTVYEPPPPPDSHLNVGYVSSDFNNHPLAHLMQSVFGMHNCAKVRAYCYATTASDGSTYRKQIEQESPCFRDCSTWSIERLVNQIVGDGIHILVNLNGYTRGAKNEVFAARPAPIQMSFMGFAGTLGAEWCDYLLADELAIPRTMLRPYRNNVSILDHVQDRNNDDDGEQWVYGENIIYARETFFCCDHKQSAPDAHERRLLWPEEIRRRQTMRQEIFPDLPKDVVILGNFNQLYKVMHQSIPCPYPTTYLIMSD